MSQADLDGVLYILAVWCLGVLITIEITLRAIALPVQGRRLVRSVTFIPTIFAINLCFLAGLFSPFQQSSAEQNGKLFSFIVVSVPCVIAITRLTRTAILAMLDLLGRPVSPAVTILEDSLSTDGPSS